MYTIIKSVIAAGGFKLEEIQYKIKKIYALGDLKEQQMEELLALAADSVSADAERPAVLEMLRNLSDRIDALEAKINAGEDESGETTVEHEIWTPWDGISDKYQNGAIVYHAPTDKLWQSVFGGQNVWEPGAAGEQFWKEYLI